MRFDKLIRIDNVNLYNNTQINLNTLWDSCFTTFH